MDELAGLPATAALLLALASAGVPVGAAGQERPDGADEPARGGEASIEGTFVEGTHESGYGSRRYRLFVPEGIEAPSPLLVMLHGCTQDPADLAAGTRMHEEAGAEGWLVLFPEQPARAHPQRCWNWYRPADQAPGSGEPAILAGMIEDVIDERDVDPGRVRVAGISAGAGMALVLAAVRPDLFDGVGLHSGVPYASARSREEAIAVMAGEGPDRPELARRLRAASTTAAGEASGAIPLPPLVVFHGTADEAVDPSNAWRILAAWHGAAALLADDAETGARHPGVAEAPREPDPPPDLPDPTGRERGEEGRSFERLHWPADAGRGPMELWRVEGLGHAWSGGRPEGSYADPRGPSATRAMIRFFRRPAGGGE